MAQLPEIEMTCRLGHLFTTRARGGSSLTCPVCRKGGVRTQVWIPKNRPKTEREARELADRAAVAEAPAAGSELADRWEQETPWPGKLITLGGRAGDECSECGDPLQWEPGRTVTYCQPCKRLDLPAAVAEHYRRQDQRSAEVAVRSAPAAPMARGVRVRLRALQQRMADQVDEWIEAFDPDGLDGGIERLALDYQAELAAYLPEIRNAADESELAAIIAEVNEVIERGGTTLDAIERHREAIERQAEYAQRQAEAAELAERQAREAEREARQRAAIEAQQRKAIESRTPRKPATVSSGNGYVDGMAMIVGMIEKNRQNKERKLEKNGPCGYDQEHKKPVIAERRYWIMTLDWQGNESGYELPGAPSTGACRKHFAMADVWIQEQATLVARQRNAQIKAVYTELT